MYEPSVIKVSVCISVHNTEKLLRRCLDSIINQTLKNIEIILVNNGSTDSSLEIMHEYRERFPDIVSVYSQEDRGLAQGRQTGIDNAKGEYIAFLDADDYVKNDAYEKMYISASKHNVDIVECSTIREGKIIQSGYNGIHRTSEILKDYFLSGVLPTMIWMRLYRRNLFVEPVMPNMYVNNEDIFAFPCLLYKAKNIFYLKESLHYYTTDNEQSVMIKVNKKISDEEKIIKNRVKTLFVIDHIKNYIGIDNIESKYSQEFKMFTARTILNFCLNDFKTLRIKGSIKVAGEKTGINVDDLRDSFKTLKHFNKAIQRSINFLGFEKTLILYKFSKRILSFVILPQSRASSL